MDWILFFFALQLTYTPENIKYLESDRIIYEEVFNISFEPEFILFDFLHIKGKANVLMVFKNTTFDPLSLDSKFNIFVNYKGFSLGYEHSCTHPIISWGHYYSEYQVYDAFYDNFYLRFSTKRNE